MKIRKIHINNDSGAKIPRPLQRNHHNSPCIIDLEILEIEIDSP